MFRVAIGQAEGLDADEVVAEVIGQCEAQLAGCAPVAGILVVAGAVDHARVVAGVRARYPALLLVGSGSRGVMSTPWGYSEDAVGLALLVADRITIRAGLGRACSRDPAGAVATALAEARAPDDDPEALCFAIADGRSVEAAVILRALTDQLAPGCVLFGGAAGVPWDAPNDEPVLFFGDEVLTDAIVALLISGPVEIAHCIENSWTPVGERQRVTASTGAACQRIGERTAVDFYQHYLGPHTQPAFEFPLAVFDCDDPTRYYLRIPITYELERGVVRFSGAVPEGAEVQLTEVMRPHMLEQTRRSLDAAAAELPGAPSLTLVFSCTIRKQILGTQAADETAIVRQTLRDTPMFGFYALGEIAPVVAGGPSVMHNSTLVAVLLRERGAAADAAADPLAWRPRSTGREDQVELLARKLARAEAQRARLEEYRELNNVMLRTIAAEIERSRQEITAQNAELVALNDALAREKQRSEELLLNILPRDVADELKRTGHVEPVFYSAVTVLFTDFKGFTQIASTLSPRALIDALDHFFSRFDQIAGEHGLEKLKTIGDAYMAAAGIPRVRESHAVDAVAAAWDIQRFMAQENRARIEGGREPWPLRIGIHTGPLMAGVIGSKKFAYDIWGDTVNIASRLETSGQPGRINISRATHELVADRFRCSPRGVLPIKNAGSIEMFFVDGPAAE
ncbi:MAG: FIST C-terminal domain-containing protein [Myxococcales bacterium]|nr:FIST C-terminal domain-containing protein [Myxococcales bacterium]